MGRKERYITMTPLDRLSFFIRDGLACVFCGAGAETFTHLRIAPVRPNKPSVAGNVVTVCLRCYKARGDRSVLSYSRSVAEFLGGGIAAADIRRHVHRSARRLPQRKKAEAMFAKRGYTQLMETT